MMPNDPQRHHRRSIRLRSYDYTEPGAYFVTLCTQDHVCLFGRVVADVMQLNDAGLAADACWREIPVHFPQVALGEFVIMPNHVHGILIIVGANDDSPLPPGDHPPIATNNDPPVGANNYSPLRPRGTSNTIGSVVRGFKIGVAKWLRQNAAIRDVWQRNYYEHIIRNEQSLNHIRRYVVENPLRWAWDRENPAATAPEPPDAWQI